MGHQDRVEIKCYRASFWSRAKKSGEVEARKASRNWVAPDLRPTARMLRCRRWEELDTFKLTELFGLRWKCKVAIFTLVIWLFRLHVHGDGPGNRLVSRVRAMDLFTSCWCVPGLRLEVTEKGTGGNCGTKLVSGQLPRSASRLPCASC